MGTFVASNFHTAVYLGVLYLVYKLLLAGENQPGLNRAVIFGIIITAFAAWPIKQLMSDWSAHSNVAANVDAGVGVVLGTADFTS